MASKRQRRSKLNTAFWITLGIGVTFAYFLFLSWRKLTDMIGDSNVVWALTGGIVLIGILTGYFSINKITDRFTK